MHIDDFLSRLEKVSPAGKNAWKARCPAHKDNGPSLSVKLVEDGKIIIKCFAGCGPDDVLNSMGLTFKDIMSDASKPEINKRKYAKAVAYYDYVDADGNLLFQVVRKEGKAFTQRIPNPDFNSKKRDSKANPKWLWGRTRYGVDAVIYRLDKVTAQIKAGKAIYIAEGEKDVETLEKLGLVATCNPGGAGPGKWEPQFSTQFKGAKAVVILADNDRGPDEVAPGKQCWQGQCHALAVQKSLKAVGVENTKVMTMPDISGQRVKDISDWVALGGNLKQFKAAVRSAPPLSPEKYLNSETSETLKNKPTDSKSDSGKELWRLIAIALADASMDDDNNVKRLTQGERRKIITSVVFDWLLARGKFFHHADNRDHASSMYFDSKLKTLQLIDSDQFGSWLARESRVNRTDYSFNHCISHLHDMALSGEYSQGVIPGKYFERRGEKLYISCGDTHIVKVTNGGIELVDNGTDNIVFSVGYTLQPWKLVPTERAVDPFDRCTLFSGMATSDPAGKLLTKLWILGLLYGHVTKPPIVFAGGVGSGKTRTAVGIYEILGLPIRVTSITDKLEDDFWVSLDQGGLVTWDNADTRIRWLADALAAASTNGSHEVRKKYSDSDIIRHQAKANVIITSANATFAGDAGLADRLIVIRLERNTRETAESRLSREIAIHRNAALTWLCHILSKALNDTEAVPPVLNRRHPDWAEFALKCGRAMGCEDHALSALKSAELDKSRFAVENDFYGSLLLQLIPEKGLKDVTSTKLVEMIKENADLDERTKKEISARKLGKRLKNLWPHIEQVFKATVVQKSNVSHYSFMGLVGLNKESAKTSQQSLLDNFSQSTPLNPLNPQKVKIARELKKEMETLPPDAIDDFEWIDEAIKEIEDSGGNE